MRREVGEERREGQEGWAGPEDDLAYVATLERALRCAQRSKERNGTSVSG